MAKRIKREIRDFIYQLNKTPMTQKEIAERLGISPSTVRRIVCQERERITFDDKAGPRGEYVGPWPDPETIWE